MLFKAAFRTAIASAVVVTGAATVLGQNAPTTAPTRGQISRAAAGADYVPGPEIAELGDSECMRNGRSPASLLLFPEYDNRFGRNTLFTITNTDTDMTSDDAIVEIWYIDENSCLKNDYTIRLTPGDTITLLTRSQHPSDERGYAFAFAKNTSGQAVSNNVLIGQEIYLDGIGLGSLDWSVNAVGFKAIPPRGQPTDLESPSGDGNRDLDGEEYEYAPERIHVPRFLGQDLFSNSTLTLIGLTGREFTTVVWFSIYNDNEEMFSKQFAFSCWTKIRLKDLSGSFDNDFLRASDHDAGEIVGAPGQEAGWFSFIGQSASSGSADESEPAVYGVLVEDRFGARVADLPWDEGCRRGSLLPLSPFGDSD